MMEPSKRGSQNLYGAGKDRVITSFQKPYLSSSCPTKKFDFSPEARSLCTKSKNEFENMKSCKVVIVGDMSVGKTCLVNRFCHNVFNRDYKATIGVDFEVEIFSILSMKFSLHIWDTAGQEKFQSIASSYYRSAHVVIVMFDLSNLHTLAHCKEWMETACQSQENETLKFLVGTKRDLVCDPAYDKIEENALDVAESIGAEFWSVSSKTSENIKELFFRVASLSFDRSILRSINPRSPISIGNTDSNLIKVNANIENLYEKNDQPRSRCCKF